MKRLILPALFALAFAGCNFSDDVTFPGADPNNGNTNNETVNNGEPDLGGEDGGDNNGTGGAEVEVTDVLVNGNALPTEILAGSGTFEVTGTVTATNSPDCEGCNIQVVVSVPDGGLDCLTDAPAGTEISGTATLEAPESPGARQLLYKAYEEADCDAAIALAENANDAESLGQITFTAPDDLSVIAVTPGPDELDVVVDSTVRVSFNGPVDAGSVTGRVRLDSGGTPVVSTVAVEGSEIVVTPQAALTEFQTVYTLNVTAGITSGTRTLENDYTSTFTTRMFVPDVFYVGQVGVHGQAYSLAIDGAKQCTMLAGSSATEQQFRFVPRQDADSTRLRWVAYNSNPVSSARALAGLDSNSPCIMQPRSEPPEDSQLWTFKRKANGSFWMQNKLFNEALSLDGTATDLSVTGNSAAPLMQTTLIDEPQENRQDWIWRRAP